MRNLRGKVGTVVSATKRMAASRACRVCVLPRESLEEGDVCAEGMNACVNTERRLPGFPPALLTDSVCWHGVRPTHSLL